MLETSISVHKNKWQAHFSTNSSSTLYSCIHGFFKFLFIFWQLKNGLEKN